MLVALLAISLRGPDKWRVEYMSVVRDLLWRMEISNVPWAQVVVAVFDHLSSSLNFLISDYIGDEETTRSNLTNVARRKEIPREESLWLLRTLSESHSEWWIPDREPLLIGICLAILSDHAPEKDDDIELLEAVVTLAALSCSPEYANRLQILTRSREHPWLFLNIRNPALFANWFDDIPSDYHQQLVSLLFLVVYSFIVRRSYPLAVQYFTVITAKGDLL